MTRRRGEGVKRRETGLASDQFPKCSPCNSGNLSGCLPLGRIFTPLNSLVLYGWRSLEATVRMGLKDRGRRLKPKS